MSSTNVNTAKKRIFSQTSIFAAFHSKSTVPSGRDNGKASTEKRSKVNGAFSDEQTPCMVFCDLDGVLVDFSNGVKKLTGKYPTELKQSAMWSAIGRCQNFYRNLEWTPDGQELWDAIRHLKPIILTGVPRFSNAANQKFEWCKRELCVEVQHINMAGPKQSHQHVSSETNAILDKREHGREVTKVITCWSKNKHCESRQGFVLIDDRVSLQKDWEARGGVFVHHINAIKTIETLTEKGILKK